MLLRLFIGMMLFGIFLPSLAYATQALGEGSSIVFPIELQSYDDASKSIMQRLQNRIDIDPFNLFASLVFLLAIIHTFLANKFTAISHRLKKEHDLLKDEGLVHRNSVSKSASFMHYMGEVEVVFGLWAVVLMMGITLFYNAAAAVDYLSNKVVFTEAMFVVVIMILASTRPILKLAEILMRSISTLFGASLTAWWLSILTIGPLLGSFITEPAAMTISAILLVRKFYVLEPSDTFKYATLGLLFVNISVGGTLTNFAAPPILMVSETWGWSISFMLETFGWKTVIGILFSNLLYAYAFKDEFARLTQKFTVNQLKDEILTKHFSREEMENEVDAIGRKVSAYNGYREELLSLSNDYSNSVETQLKKRYLKNISALGIEEALAKQAFDERFYEVWLYRMQRAFPYLLTPSQRAPFKDPNWDEREDSVPFWVMGVHIFFMVWTIVNAHNPVLFIYGLLFFLAFATVTSDSQNNIDIKSPLLVGFFLGGLVIHGGVQGWWIEPILGSLEELPLMAVVTVMTAFNDNAAITYLSTLVPGFTDELKYAVVSAAVTGGGLTVIANAPNPAGQSILNKYFTNGINPLGLLLGALIPTIIMFVVFYTLSP